MICKAKKTVTSEGLPCVNIIGLDKNSHAIHIWQNLFTKDPPGRGETLLRKWKGHYYVTRGLALKPETFNGMIANILRQCEKYGIDPGIYGFEYKDPE
jgi:hypothetical protein